MAIFKLSSYWQEKLACSYFFACPGIAYGIFTARMPALKHLAKANDAQIGFMLLAFGAASFCGLLSSRFLIERFGAKTITGVASIMFSIFFMTASLSFTYWWLLGFGMLAGLFMGLCDVAMNAQGIIIENTHHHRCISFFHASYSLGGVLGSLAGSLFAALHLSPFLNFICMQGLYLCLWRLAWTRLVSGQTSMKKEKNKDRSRLPLLLIIFGCMSMCCYVSEGSVGEWGSILLHSVKGASQQMAALVFGAFSITMVIGRFMGDGLRARFTDFQIVFAGSSIAFLSMLVVLLSAEPVICLCGYACMGIGFAPIVPILYSRAGNFPGVSAARASSAVSLLSYSGLLVVPPLIGIAAQLIGLDKALWLIVFAIAGIICGSFKLSKKV